MNKDLEKTYSERVSKMSDLEIVNNYNWETLGKGWTNNRAMWINCIRREIVKRWGESDWCKNSSMSLKYPIVLVQNKLIWLFRFGLCQHYRPYCASVLGSNCATFGHELMI